MWSYGRPPEDRESNRLVGRASLDLATLGLKVRADRFHGSSALANSHRDLH
jgi:hypothetical protein